MKNRNSTAHSTISDFLKNLNKFRPQIFDLLSNFALSGSSSVGRVHVWGAWGRRFKSCFSDNDNQRVAMQPFLILALLYYCRFTFLL